MGFLSCRPCRSGASIPSGAGNLGLKAQAGVGNKPGTALVGGGRRRLDAMAGVPEDYTGVSEANALISAASFVQAGKLVQSCLTVICGLWSLIIINR